MTAHATSLPCARPACRFTLSAHVDGYCPIPGGAGTPGGMRFVPEQAKPERPRVVVLCGSTRFHEAFQRANYEQTMAGKIVLSVGFYRPSPESRAERQRYEHHGENIGCTPEQKRALDELHLRKIDLADEVLVLNVGGYIGDSTRAEIAYALNNQKPVRFLEAGA